MKKWRFIIVALVMAIAVGAAAFGCTDGEKKLIVADESDHVETVSVDPDKSYTLRVEGFNLTKSKFNIVTNAHDDRRIHLSLSYGVFRFGAKLTVNGDVIRVKGPQDYKFKTSDITLTLGVPLKEIHVKGDSTYSVEGQVGDGTEFSASALDKATLKFVDVQDLGRVFVQADQASKIEYRRLTCNQFVAKIDRASRLNVDLDADSATFSVDRASGADVQGEARMAFWIVQNASEANGKQMVSVDAHVSIKDASRLSVYAMNRLSGTVQDASTLTYLGNPSQDVTKDITSKIDSL